MKILLFGSTGKLGLLVARKAIERGHEVTACKHGAEPYPISHPKLSAVFGDIYQPDTVLKAFNGHEVVISALGRHGIGAPLICRDGIKVIIPTMQKTGVKRLIAVSAFGSREHRNFSLYTSMLRLGIPKQMQDKDEMEELIRKSDLDWTVIRPAAYLDSWPRKGYELQTALSGLYPVVTRNGIADSILDQLENPKAVHQAFAVRAK